MTLTLTEQLHTAIKSDTKKWNKDHVKAFFKSRLEKPLNDASSIAVLNRAGELEGVTRVVINGKVHVYSSLSNEARQAFEAFLYGRRATSKTKEVST